MRRHAVLAAFAAAIVLALPGAASAAGLDFSSPRALPGSPPKGSAQGGEPSATFDPGGRFLYLAAPGGEDHGGNFWRSARGGQPGSFAKPLQVGSKVGGGDSDVAVAYDAAHTVYYVDLEELAFSDLCRSTDHGKSFGAGCTSGFPSDQQDPAVDRPWVTTVRGKPSLLYDTYDGLAVAGGAPEVQVSTDRGTTFTPCGQVLQPGGDAQRHFSVTGAAENSEVIGKPAVGGDGTLYVPFTEPHRQGQVARPDPTPGNLYMGIARRGCSGPSSSFHDVTVFKNDSGAGSDFVSIFPDAAVDGGGTVYALAAGRLTGNQRGQGVYLFVSRDGGRHFRRPIKVNVGPPQATQLAALAPGNGSGEVLVGWYSSAASPSPSSNRGRWYYHVAETFDFGKSFARAKVDRTPFHYGNICNLGVLCSGNQDRNLLDFTSVAVNPRTGCGFTVFAGDAYDRHSPGAKPSSAYTAVQTAGPCLIRRNSGRHFFPKPPRHRQRSPRFTG